MRLLAVFFLLMTYSAQASPEFICSLQHGRATYRELQQQSRMNDKTKHCILSCYLAVKCGSMESWHIGLVKELLDLLGAGEPSLADLQADLVGITLAESRRAQNKAECWRECQLVYP